ncbi:hypothetical protein ACHHYP_09175 [Achlya hypogyna]|uniref:Uncharacterized protein n=1 Tax=Achlya hypogyna TaxID=1202772 RepID=A0A1V9ZJL2_ACHHY|nr:hypothetical protein ACHHYP_09175 [Achlya hypogyna]
MLEREDVGVYAVPPPAAVDGVMTEDELQVLAAGESFLLTLSSTVYFCSGDDVKSLPFLPGTSAMSEDGKTVLGWINPSCVSVYYEGCALISRVVEIPSTPLRTFLLRSRVVSSSLFEFVLLVVCSAGHVVLLRIQNTIETSLELANLTQWHPTITSVALDAGVFVVAGGVRSSSAHMALASSLSLWKITLNGEPSMELQDFTTVLGDDASVAQLELESNAAGSAGLWAAAKSFLGLPAEAEAVAPGHVTGLAISPDGSAIALLDRAGRVSLRTVDTCAVAVPWTLVLDALTRSVCWFGAQLVLGQLGGALVVCPGVPAPATFEPEVLQGHTPDVASAAVVPRGASGFYLASVGSGGSVHIAAFAELPVADVLQRRIALGHFDAALALAVEAALDTDDVHKAAAPTVADVATRIERHLRHVGDTSWVQHTVAATLPETAVDCARLWRFGLELDPSFTVLARLLDLLETFLALVHVETAGTPPPSLDALAANASLAPFFHPHLLEAFMDASTRDTATALARDGRVAALGVLLERYGLELLPDRLALLSELPLCLEPAAYASLLPSLPADLADAAAPYYTWQHGCSKPALLRPIPGLALDVAEWAALAEPPPAQAAALADWFCARAVAMETQFGQLDGAKALLDLAVDCLGPAIDLPGVDQVAVLHGHVAAFAAFVYDCGVAVPLEWTLGHWLALADAEKLAPLVAQPVAVTAAVAAHQLFTEAQLAKFLGALDVNDAATLRYVAAVVQASCPRRADRILCSDALLVETALSACFGFTLAGRNAPQDTIELAWAIFESLPAHAPPGDAVLAALMAQVDELQALMDGMERCAAYGLHYSPQELQTRATDEAFATTTLEHLGACAADAARAVADARDLAELVFLCLSPDRAAAIVLGSVLALPMDDVPPTLQTLLPTDAAPLLLAAAQTHVQRANGAAAPSLTPARTLLAWTPPDDDRDALLGVLDAARALEGWTHASCAPKELLAKTPAARLELLHDVFVLYPDSGVADHAADLAAWLQLRDAEWQLCVWAAYALLQTRHFERALVATTDLLTALPAAADARSVVLSLALDVVSCAGCVDWAARAAVAARALVHAADPALEAALLGWQKKLRACARAAALLELSAADLASFDQQTPEAAWLLEQLAAYEEVVAAVPAAVLTASQVALQLATAYAPDSTPPLAALEAVARASLAALTPGDDPTLVLAYVAALPSATAHALWLAHFEQHAQQAEAQAWIAALAAASLEGTAFAAAFATLETASAHTAQVDKLAAASPSLDRARFEVDEDYRYDALATTLRGDPGLFPDALEVVAQYAMEPWQLAVQFVEALLLSPAPREIELKKAQTQLPTQTTVLALALSRPGPLVQRLLRGTYVRVPHADLVALEYLWRLVSLAWQQEPTLSLPLPIDRVKLLIPCARELRKLGVTVDFKAFAGLDLDLPAQAAAGVQALVPVLTGHNIRLLANMLKKVHGVATSSVVLIYLDCVLARATADIALAYESCAPFASGLSTDHLLTFLQLLLDPTRCLTLHGHVFRTPTAVAPSVAPRKRLEMLEDTYALVTARADKQKGVAFLEAQAPALALAALLADWGVVADIAFPLRDPAALPLAAWLAADLSLAQCHVLVAVAARLGVDVEAAWAASIDAALALPDAALAAYCRAKWHDAAPPAWLSRVRMPGFKALAGDAPTATEAAWLQCVQTRVKVSARAHALLAVLAASVPASKLRSVDLSAMQAAAAIVATLAAVQPAADFAPFEADVMADLAPLLAHAVAVVPDTPAGNDALRRVLQQWQAFHGVASRGSWATERDAATERRLGLESAGANDPNDSDGLAPLWQLLWQRRGWAIPELAALLQADAMAYASLREADVHQLMTSLPTGRVALGLLSPFASVHELVWDELLAATATPTTLLDTQLILLRFEGWSQLPVPLLHNALTANRSPSERGELWLTTSVAFLVLGLLRQQDYVSASRAMAAFTNLHPLLQNNLDAGLHLLRNYVRAVRPDDIPPTWARHWELVRREVEAALP